MAEHELQVNCKVLDNEELTHEELIIRNDYLQEQIRLLVRDVDLFFQDKPNENGQYLHSIYCNGSNTFPISYSKNKLCNCKYTPLVKRLKKQAVEEYLEKMIDEGFPFV